jgi:hypothetical protein
MTIRLSKNGKRLGRPPKNASADGGQTFVIHQKHEAPKFELSSEEMIECSLVPINEFSHIKSEVQRVGRYAQSTYSLNKFGKNGFVVLAYVDANLKKYRDEGISDEQIVRRCVNYLNQETKKKKPYGNLQLYGYRLIEKFGKEVIAIEMVTDSKSNPNFWGTGNR